MTTRPMITDGKRMRPVWQPGDGNGDPNQELFEKSQYIVKGHPTWKIFTGDVNDVIVRGQDEPPRYVYLDDRSAHAISCSKAYSAKEKNAYWGYDFNLKGQIRKGRPNRGRAAYDDVEETILSTCILQGKGPPYVFSGEPIDGPGYRHKSHSKVSPAITAFQAALDTPLPASPARSAYSELEADGEFGSCTDSPVIFPSNDGIPIIFTSTEEGENDSSHLGLDSVAKSVEQAPSQAKKRQQGNPKAILGSTTSSSTANSGEQVKAQAPKDREKQPGPALSLVSQTPKRPLEVEISPSSLYKGQGILKRQRTNIASKSSANSVQAPEAELDGLKDQVANSQRLIEKLKEDVDNLCKQLKDSQKTRETRDKEIERLRTQILALQKDVVSHKEAMENINLTAKKFGESLKEAGRPGTNSDEIAARVPEGSHGAVRAEDRPGSGIGSAPYGVGEAH